jgi:hypothetical protein
MGKYSDREGILEIFCKENHFSGEKSPGLSQVGRPSTAHPCRGWRGGFEDIIQKTKKMRNNLIFFPDL